MIAIKPSLSRLAAFAFILILLLAAALPPQTARAAGDAAIDGPGWAVIVGQETVNHPSFGYVGYDALYMLNTGTNTVFGPFLKDELTTISPTGKPLGRDVYDVDITPDGRTALVTSFVKQKLFFVDITNPLQPAFLSALAMPTYIEEVFIAPGGRFAIITDGGSNPHVITVDIPARAIAFDLTLPQFIPAGATTPVSAFASAAAAAPDGTVIVADYTRGAIHTLLMAQDGTLTYTGSHQYFVSKEGMVSLTPQTGYQTMKPINVAIAPDGVTVLIPDGLNYVNTSAPSYSNQYPLGVFRITAPGTVQFANVLTRISHVVQTIAFNEAGTKALMLGADARTFDSSATPAQTFPNDRLLVVDILGPGSVALNEGESVDLHRWTYMSLFGLESVAVYRGKAYMTYGTQYTDETLYPQRHISIVNLSDYSLVQLPWGPSALKLPLGIAIKPYIPERLYLPLVKR